MFNHLFRLIVATVFFSVPFSGHLLAKTEDVCVPHFCVQTITDGNDVAVIGINKSDFTPYSVKFDLELKNMDVFPEKQRREFVVPAGQRLLLFVLRGKENAAWSYRYEFRTQNGDVEAVHDKEFKYRVPIAKGTSAYVSQSCNGTFSHFGPSKHAIDLTMNVGTPIHAARGGQVIAVKEDSDKRGNTKDFIDDANEIKILHDDGTIGFYVHLKKDGALVEPGQHVRKGEKIALSGNTGWTTAPHLHFEVFTVNENFITHTVPIKFATSKGIVSCVDLGDISPG
ncbi:MAG: M23 family metallopeptidase [Pseudomonadota bacterium]